MHNPASSSTVRPARLLLGAAAVSIAMVAAGATTAVTTASASAATKAHAVTAFKRRSKPKPKPRPKPQPKTVSYPEAPPSGSARIYEEGSSLMYPLFQLWGPAYQKQYSNVSVIPAAGGSGKGISDAASGVVDIGASDAYLSSAQVSQYPGIKNIALAISAQMINYNVPGLSGSVHLRLSGQVISQIYQGKISSWNDPAIASLNPGVNLPADKIVALHRSDSSGDTFIFSSFLSASDPSGWGSSISYGTSISFPSISNALGESGNGGMVTGCQSTPGCIAYIGVSYMPKTQAAGLGEAALENASGHFELPDASTVSAEAAALESKTPANESLSMIYDSASDGYPIVNYEYAILPPKASSNHQAEAVKAFLYWCIDPNKGNSMSFLNQVNFQPLPPAVTALSAAQIAQISG